MVSSTSVDHWLSFPVHSSSHPHFAIPFPFRPLRPLSDPMGGNPPAHCPHWRRPPIGQRRSRMFPGFDPPTPINKSNFPFACSSLIAFQCEERSLPILLRVPGMPCFDWWIPVATTMPNPLAPISKSISPLLVFLPRSNVDGDLSQPTHVFRLADANRP